MFSWRPETQRQADKTTLIYWVIPLNTYSSWRLASCNPGWLLVGLHLNLHGWQGFNHWNHHLLPPMTFISNKVESREPLNLNAGIGPWDKRISWPNPYPFQITFEKNFFFFWEYHYRGYLRKGQYRSCDLFTVLILVLPSKSSYNPPNSPLIFSFNIGILKSEQTKKIFWIVNCISSAILRKEWKKEFFFQITLS